MTERSRRQQRLLAVRDLQADLAAAHLRGLRAHGEALRNDLAHWQSFRVDAPAANEESSRWLLSCAEKELALLRADEMHAQIAHQATLIEQQAAEERERRVAREQMQRLCDRARDTARALEERTVQASLDDIFSAARLRRLAEAANRGR